MELEWTPLQGPLPDLPAMRLKLSESLMGHRPPRSKSVEILSLSGYFY